MKQCFVDLETTGLDPRTAAIIQIGVIVADEDILRTKWSTNVKPHAGAEIDANALEITGTIKEELDTFLDPKIVYNRLFRLLSTIVNKYDKSDKMMFVGYNARFDMDFLREFFIRNGDKFFGSYFWFPPIDVMNLAAEYLKHERNRMDNFKLDTVLKRFEISRSTDTHDAMEDIELTHKLYNKLKRVV